MNDFQARMRAAADRVVARDAQATMEARKKVDAEAAAGELRLGQRLIEGQALDLLRTLALLTPDNVIDYRIEQARRALQLLAGSADTLKVRGWEGVLK